MNGKLNPFRRVSTRAAAGLAVSALLIGAGATPASAAGATIANDDTIHAGGINGRIVLNVTANDQPSAQVESVTVIAGTVPNGLTQWNGGYITGYPTECGDYSYTYELTSTSGSTDTATVDIQIDC